MKPFIHPSLNLEEKTKIVFIAMSKHTFYFRRLAVKYVLEKEFTPISQYGIFDYFLTDVVDRNYIRRANNNLIRMSNELWVFGAVSDGVLAEIILAKKNNKPVKYFEIIKSQKIKKISKYSVSFEDKLEKYKKGL